MVDQIDDQGWSPLSRIDAIADEVIKRGEGAVTALLTDDGTALPYADLARRIQEVGQSLIDAGLVDRQRVVLVGENSLDMIVGLLGTIRAGGVPVPLNARMSAAELDAVCEHAAPRLVYFAADQSDDARRHAQRRSAQETLPPLPGGRLQWCISVEQHSDNEELHGVALMLYTSGTMGQPKGVMLTHTNLDFVTRLSLMQDVLRSGDSMFHALPISHSYGLVSGLLCGLRAGATLRLVGRFSAQRLGEAIIDGSVSVFQGVPAMYARLHEWAHAERRQLVPNRLRMIYIGGSSVDAARKRQTESMLGLRLHHGYGLTEAAPLVTRTFGHPPPQEVTAGWPVPGIEVRLCDASGKQVSTGQRGEVCVRGPNVMRGYFRDASQTSSTIDPNGWLHTGDVGVFGPDGDLSIVGRSKEMIIRGGFNVFPAEVERAIAEFPGVAQSAVVGRSVSGDEQVIAYIEPMAGRHIETVRLLDFLRVRLTAYKVPSELHVMERLPASATGKLLKQVLKELAQTGSPQNAGNR